MRLTESSRVLIPRFDGVGDLVLLAGLLEALSSRCGLLTVLVRQGMDELAPLFPDRLRWESLDIDAFAEPPPAQLRALHGWLRQRRFDLILGTRFAPTWADEAVAVFAPREARRIAFGAGDGAACASSSLTRALAGLPREEATPRWDLLVPVDAALPEVRKYDALWSALCASAAPLPAPRLRVPEPWAQRAAELLRALGLRPGAYAVCCPTGTRSVAFKAWPEDRYAELVAWLERERGCRSLLVGHESEVATLRRVEGLAAERGSRPAVWCGHDGELPLLAALSSSARLYLGNDTGAMHVAAALDVPTVAVFGGGTWPRFVPATATLAVVRPLPCFACAWDCIFGAPLCLEAIDTATVRAALERALAGEIASGAASEIVAVEPQSPSVSVSESALDHVAQRLARVEADRAARLEVIERLRTAGGRQPCDPPPLEARPGLRRRLRRLRTPRLGVLRQYPPRPLQLEPAAPGVGAATRISIVTPSYNHGRFLERTLRSVLAQDCPGLEYVVQDGGSLDGTVDVLERHADRLAFWESVEDGGQADALNRGFRRTSGDIMAFLNSDDLLLPGALAEVARFFAEHPQVDVIYGHRVIIDEDDREVGRWILPPHDDGILAWADFVPQETLFWRRRAWDAAGGCVDDSFDFAIDWDLLLRFRDAGCRFARIPRFLAAFRLHPQSKTMTVLGETGEREMNRLRQRVLGRVPSSGEIERALRPFLARHLLHHYAWRLGLLRLLEG